jgi:hypothetical protein
VFPSYFKGIMLQNQGKYQLADEQFSNAKRLHEIWTKKKTAIKSSYPEITDALRDLPEYSNLFQN